MAENEEVDLDAKKGSGNKKMIVLYVVIGLLLVGVSVTTTLLLLGGDGDEGAKQEASAEEGKATKGDAIYLPLKTMVVNFGGQGPAQFLQVDIQVMTRDSAVKEAIETHMPVIRNDLLLLLSNQSYEQVSTLEGKEKLREQVLETLRKDLKAQGEPDAVEAVYFTSFVMQ